MKWIPKPLRSLFWWASAPLRALVRFDLHNLIHRKSLPAYKRVLYRLLINVQTLFEGAFLVGLITFIYIVVVIGYPLAWVGREIRDTWTDWSNP